MTVILMWVFCTAAVVCQWVPMLCTTDRRDLRVSLACAGLHAVSALLLVSQGHLGFALLFAAHGVLWASIAAVVWRLRRV